MHLFHITPKTNVPSILEHGIRYNKIHPGFRSLRWRQRHIRPGAVFLTDDVSFIVKTQLTPGWIMEHRAVVLSIEAQDLNIQKFAKHEFTCDFVPAANVGKATRLPLLPI